MNSSMYSPVAGIDGFMVADCEQHQKFFALFYLLKRVLRFLVN